MTKILTDNWQIAENLTDYWHLPWVLLSTDKGPEKNVYEFVTTALLAVWFSSVLFFGYY